MKSKHFLPYCSFVSYLDLFEGTLEDLGLDELAFKYPWVPMEATTALKSMGLGPIEQEPAGGANNALIKEIAMKSVAEGKAKLVCSQDGKRVKIDGREWDRSPDLTCNEWHFAAGTIYTSLAFNGNPSKQVNLDGPGLHYIAISKLTKPFSNPPEYTFPQHSHWFLSYASEDEHSRFTWAFGSQDPDAATPVMSKMDLLRLLVWGAPKHAPVSLHIHIVLVSNEKSSRPFHCVT